MRIPVAKIRPLLATGRVFLMGPGVNSIDDTGISYKTGSNTNIQPRIEIEPYTTFWGTTGTSLVSMGAFSYTHSTLPHRVRVGRYTSIAGGLKVMGADHPTQWASTSPVFYNRKLMMNTFEEDQKVSGHSQKFQQNNRDIVIGNDVWVGAHVTLARGVTIGDGAIIASNSVVTKNVAPFTIVGGVPAKTIKPRFEDATSDRLMRSQWWQYSPDQLSDLDMTNPRCFADEVLKRAESGSIHPFTPTPLTYADFSALA